MDWALGSVLGSLSVAGFSAWKTQTSALSPKLPLVLLKIIRFR